jgi:hypothetical protein
MVFSNYSLPVDSVDGVAALANAVRGVPQSWVALRLGW